MKLELRARMPNKEPLAYEKWEIISPDLPPRSRLYSLEPIGVGTAWVESLTGYIARLAEAHCVSTALLFRKEIDALTGRGNIFNRARDIRLEENAGYSTHIINGCGVPAKDFVRALESLTYRAGLRYLTLTPWKEVLPKGGVLRRARAWCAKCLRMWQADAKPIYEPLLWTLKPVILCPLHQRALSFTCPICKRQNRILDSRTRPGHCSLCKQWLAPTGTEVLPDQALTNEDSVWGEWVAIVLGEILAAAPRLSFVPSREHIARTIRLCVEHIAGGNSSAFAREMGVGGQKVRLWQTGKALPKLPSLLSLSYGLGISLLDLIRGASNQVPRKFVRSLPAQLGQRESCRPLCRFNPVDALPILQTAMGENPPPSLRQLIKRMGRDHAVIYRYFPGECRTIARRFADHRKIQAMATRDRASVEIKKAAYQLHAKGVRITTRNLRPLLTSSYYTNLQEGREALRQVRQELQQN
jgi:hypothetical protein